MRLSKLATIIGAVAVLVAGCAAYRLPALGKGVSDQLVAERDLGRRPAGSDSERAGRQSHSQQGEVDPR